MSDIKAPQTPEFYPVPNWKSTDNFELSGIELEALYNFFNIFSPALTAIQQIFSRGMQNGKIKMDYQYADGSKVPDEHIKATTKKINEYFKAQADKAKGESKESDMANEAASAVTGKVLTMTGEVATTENV